MSLPPLLSTDLDKIFIGGTSHHGLPPCKISSKSEHFKCPKLDTDSEEEMEEEEEESGASGIDDVDEVY